jgi:hypothetical protein
MRSCTIGWAYLNSVWRVLKTGEENLGGFSKEMKRLICVILISDITEKAVCFTWKYYPMDVYFHILKTRKENLL